MARSKKKHSKSWKKSKRRKDRREGVRGDNAGPETRTARARRHR